MPRRSRRPKKSGDRKSDTKKKNLLSTGIPSSSRDENTSAEGNSASISAAGKSEESSNDPERHEKAVSDETRNFPEISEFGVSSDRGISTLVDDGSSASFMQDVKKVDNLGNLKTIDDTSTDDFPVIHGETYVARQEESSEAFLLDSESEGYALENENVCEQMSSSVKASHSENYVSEEELTEVNLSLGSTLTSNAAVKEDVLYGSKPFVTEASRDENIIHQEKASALSSDSATTDSKIEENVTMKDEIDSTFQVDLCSLTKSHRFNKVESDGRELRSKRTSSTSSSGAVSTDSQAELPLEKRRGKTGAPFKHTADASGSERKMKRAKTSPAVTLQEASQKTGKKKYQRQRAKSEQASKKNLKFPSKTKYEKALSSLGTSLQSKEEKMERHNQGPSVSHQETSAARGSDICNTEKDEFETESKCLLEVSPQKRKSSENTTSFPSEKELEAIPSKRVYKGPQTSVSSTHESVSSSRITETSARPSGSGKMSETEPNCDTTTPELNRSVSSSTESMTEYLGDAAFIAVGETPPIQHEAGSANSVSSENESKTSSDVKRKPPRYKVKVVKAKKKKTTKKNSKTEPSQEMSIILQTESVKEYLEVFEDSSTDGEPMQPRMGVLSTEVTSRRAKCSHTASSIADRNLNVADMAATQSAESSTEREAERSSTVSSSESIESDAHTKNVHSMTCRGARPKTRYGNTREDPSQKGSRKGRGSNILTIRFPESSTEADHSPADSSREVVKVTDNLCAQSSSTICMGARPKTRGKNTQFSPHRGDGRGRPRFARPTDESQTELFPTFEEFKETLGVDKVEIVDINYDVFDRALGIDRSSDHSVQEHRQEFKMISPKRFSEAASYDERKNLESVDSGPGSIDPQSSETEQNRLPTIEEFRKTLRADEIPPIPQEVAFEIINKALEEMESKQRNLQSKKVVRFLIPKEEDLSTSARRTSPEGQTDEQASQNAVSSRSCINRDLIPGILAFSGCRKRGSPIGLAVPDCFDLKAISNALDEVLRSEFRDTAREIHNDPRRPEVLEDSEESIEDINRAIAKSGMKLKRSQFISSDDEFTPARTSEPVEVTLQSPTREVTVQIEHNLSETSQSSDANSEEHSGSSSECDAASSESLAELSESETSTVSDETIGEFPQISLERSSSERNLCESTDTSDNESPSKRRRKDYVEKSI